jgi:hypothetical protein
MSNKQQFDWVEFAKKNEEMSRLRERIMNEKFREFDEWTPPKDGEWKTWTGRAPQKDMVHLGNGLYAPYGWNNLLKTGNFKGCRPIIKHGARINNTAFEPINFVMV